MHGPIDGCYCYYVLVTGFPMPLVAFDERPIEVMQKLWFTTWARESQDLLKRKTEQEAAQIYNQIAAQRAAARDDYEGDLDKLTLKIPPAITPDGDDMLAWNGIPSRNGYGAFRTVATNVAGMGYVDVLDLSGTRMKIEDGRHPTPRSAAIPALAMAPKPHG